MSVAIKKLEGVESVKVSLNEGYADVKLKPGSKVTVEQVREAVRRNGFTPKAADVRALGRVVERGGRPALAVTGTDSVYMLAEDPARKGKLLELQRVAKDHPVTVQGSVLEGAAGSTDPLTLQVREYTAATP